MQTLMSQLQRANPQNFQVVNDLLKNNGNPEGLVKQIIGNFSPEQMEGLLKQAKQYGCPESILSKVQNFR